jgi:tetratricopeptide (TPR) repeat protein
MADDYPYDLGTHSLPVGTSSAAAQAWFDRGLIWCYGFNHEEAERCFERAVAADPGCAMAHWGIAYAVGPNYNKDWQAFGPEERSRAVGRGHLAAAEAVRLADPGRPLEAALIDAMVQRYPSPVPIEDCEVWNDDYAAALRRVYAQFGDDPDVACLFAEALINRTPWRLWNLVSGEPEDGADTLEAVDVLERAIAAADASPAELHPGLLHMYIHTMEMSPYPERTLSAADQLRAAVPDSGHLRHMPTHIDLLTGDYVRVVAENDLAAAADRKFLEREGALNFYALYCCHNLHFKVYGAMFLGQFDAALQAADEITSIVTEDLLRVEAMPMADWAEGFVPMRLHVLVRFGQWQTIIDEPAPADPELYCMTTALLHYAKGIAHATLGDIESAHHERGLLAEARKRVPESRAVFNNTGLDLLEIAEQMLAGEVAYRAGDVETAFAHLRRSVELDDTLPYDEPWGWMQPTRHALGALLLEQGRTVEAEAVYRADLGLDDSAPRPSRHPDTVWSLHGLHEALVRNGKLDEAARLKPRLDRALALATVPIQSSCYCRRA